MRRREVSEGRASRRAAIPASLLLAAAAAAVGCAQKLVVVEPSGDVGRDAAAGDRALDAAEASDAEPRDVAPDDSGLPDASVVEPQPDAGTAPDATATPRERAPLAWSVVGFTGSSVSAVGCAAPDAIVVGIQSGGLFRLDGQGGQTPLWRSPINATPVAITHWNDVGGLVSAVATTAELVLFDGLPEATTLRTRVTLNAEIRAMTALGVGEVLVLADRQRTIARDFAVLRFPVAAEPSQVRQVHSLPEVGTLEALAYVPNVPSPLLISGGGRIVEADLVARSEGRLELPPTWTPADVAGFDLRALARVGDERFAAGERGAVYRRASTGWVPLVAPVLREDDVWRAMVEVPGSREAGDPEGYLVGRASTPGRVPIARLYRGVVADAGGTQSWDLQDLCFVGPDLAYAVGNFRNELRGLVLRGTR